MESLPRTPEGHAHVRDVVSLLRHRVLSGFWPPGARIPTKLALRAELAISDGTLQRALDTLQRQGLLRPRGRLGTFVCDRPPHLHRIGVIHAPAPHASIWTQTIARVAQEITAEERYRLDCYLGAERQPDGTPTASLRQLETDLQERLLAGAILYSAPDEAIDLLVHSGLPGVQIAHPEKAGRFPAIVPASTTERAMQRFKSEGRRRLAIVTTFNYRGPACDAIVACARAHGLQTRHAWIHYFEPRSNPSARAVAELLMSLPRRQRPDAVYINDDHLVHEAVLGLADAGVRVPRDLSVIAYANFPHEAALALPVTRLGPDIGRILRTAVGLIEDQLAGRKPAPLTTLQPVFEEELQSATAFWPPSQDGRHGGRPSRHENNRISSILEGRPPCRPLVEWP
jgi:DNA-binding LacI/PurR family transcriptional regulator